MIGSDTFHSLVTARTKSCSYRHRKVWQPVMGLPQHEITTLAVCHDTELYHVIILPHNRVTPPLVGDRTLLAPYTDSRALITPVLKHHRHLHTTSHTHTHVHTCTTNPTHGHNMHSPDTHTVTPVEYMTPEVTFVNLIVACGLILPCIDYLSLCHMLMKCRGFFFLPKKVVPSFSVTKT